MPFGLGSIVAIPNTGGSFSDTVQPQPPLFGVIVDVAGDPLFGIVWHNGTPTALAPGPVLDQIVDADPTEVTRLSGKIVRLDVIPASPEYDGVVVALYKRDTGSSGTPGPNLALVKATGGTEFFYEVQSTGLVPVSGR